MNSSFAEKGIKYWLYLLAFLVILITLSINMLENKRERRIELARSHYISDLRFLSDYVKLELQGGHYHNVDVLLRGWAQLHLDRVVSLELIADNGFVISRFVHDLDNAQVVNFQEEIVYSYNNKATLYLTGDLSFVQPEIRFDFIRLHIIILLSTLALAFITHLALKKRKLTYSLMKRREELAHTVDALKKEMKEREQAEQERRLSEERFRRIFLNSPDPIVIHDGKTILEANPAALKAFQIDDPSDLIGEDIGRFIHPDDIEFVRQRMQQMLKDRKPLDLVEFRIITVKGEERTVTARPIPFDYAGETVFMVNYHDITNRKKAAEKIKEQQYYLEEAQKRGAIGTWANDFIKNTITWTNETYSIFGLEVDSEINPDTFYSRIHPEDLETVRSAWTAALNGEPYDLEHRIIVNGAIKWVHEKANFEFNDAGKLIKVIGIVQDISVRKETEEKLKVKILQLERMNENMVNRELKMIELKKEINALCKKAGEPVKYPTLDH